MKISRLRTLNLENPIGLSSEILFLSYLLESDGYNQYQIAYRIIASSSEEKLINNNADLWDSGKVLARETFSILYEGEPVKSRQRVYWKVMSWDKSNQPTEWSEIAYWEMGLLNEDDWQAKWIGRSTNGEDIEIPSAPMFAKEFTLNCQSKIKQARLYISGLGVYEAYINGMKIGDTFYDPGETDYRKTVQYVTYDLTNNIEPNSNVISFMLGNGMYRNYSKVNTLPERYQKTDGWQADESGFYGDLKAIAQLEIIFEDGTKEIVYTDSTWDYIEGPIVFNNWYGGEDYDATKEIEGWNIAGTIRDTWNKAEIVAQPNNKLIGRETPAIKIMEQLTPISVTALDNGNYIVDMGRNGAGFQELILPETTPNQRGIKIKMKPAEILNDVGGIDQSTCTQGDPGVIYDTYIIKGTGEEKWHARFAYHGYRYVEVENFPGIPTVDNFKGYLLRMDNEVTGSFNSSDTSINTIDRIINYSIESNMYSSLTDCPQIEKLGWLEVGNLMFHSISQRYDISTWMRKIIRDVIDSQYENGYIPAIAPEFQRINRLNNDPNWSGVIALIPWNLYEVYGDSSLMAEAYPAMIRYVDYLVQNTKDNNYLINFAEMGDWGSVEKNSTPSELVASCAFYNITDTMTKIAEVLNYKNEKSTYRTLSDKIKSSINAKYFNQETGVYATNSQASYACPLYAGVVEQENITLVVNKLVEAVKETGYHLSTGEIALKQMFTALAKNDRSDIVYAMATNRTQPSYWYFVEQGATTLPEYWDMERSQNHVMMGHVKEWFGKYLAGINLGTPAYRNIVFRPYIPSDVSMAEATIMSPYGEITSCWNSELEDSKFTITIKIPVGSTADVYIPNLQGNNGLLKINGESVAYKTERDYYLISNLGSGNYHLALS